ILIDAFTRRVEEAHAVLCHRVPLIRRLTVPAHRLIGIAIHPPATTVVLCKVILRVRIVVLLGHLLESSRMELPVRPLLLVFPPQSQDVGTDQMEGVLRAREISSGSGSPPNIGVDPVSQETPDCR